MDNLFAGYNGYIWFIGKVENNADPLGYGRVQIRIIGHHNLDKVLLPTEALPWAIVAQSTDNPIIGGTGTNKILPNGIRVVGFFMDGESRQKPMITHTLSGESLEYNLDDIPPYATPVQPNVNPLIGQTIVKETECVSGELSETLTVNTLRLDYRNLNFNPKNFVYPCTGYVSDVFMSRNGRHKGVDIATYGVQTSAGSSHLGGRYRGQTGVPVYAIADGTVYYIFKKSQGQRGVSTNYDATGTGSRSFGNAVVIRHEIDGIVMLSIYAHLGENQNAALDKDSSGVHVSVGQKVSKGQQIGTIGRTHNRDTPTHLHFELRLGESLSRGSNNLIPPQSIFPKLATRDTSILDWVNTTLSYTEIPPITQSDLPIQALEQPK